MPPAEGKPEQVRFLEASPKSALVFLPQDPAATFAPRCRGRQLSGWLELDLAGWDGTAASPADHDCGIQGLGPVLTKVAGDTHPLDDGDLLDAPTGGGRPER